MLLKLRNFLCYQELSLQQPAGRVLLLTGTNAAGKSAVIDAFRWCHFGSCRGYEKQNEAAALKGDPAKPMSVSCETTAEWEGWPRAIQRASKLTILPEPADKPFRESAKHFDAILGTWDLVRASDGDRASLINAICRASATDEQILAELQKACPAPPAGDYNGVPWKDFGDVPSALEKAEKIRRAYHSAKTATVPEEMAKELEDLKTELGEMQEVEKPGDPPAVMSQTEADNQHGKIVSDIGQCKFLERKLGELIELLGAWPDAANAAAKFQATNCGIRKSQLEAELETVSNRWDEAKKQLDAYEEKKKAFDSNFRKRATMTRDIQKLEENIKAIGDNAVIGKKKWGSWDAVVAALQPSGPVAAAVLAQAAQSINRERLQWAAKALGIEITLQDTGSITVASRSSQVSSHGQNLLAGLALQDALCLAAGVPFMLCDELEALDAEPLHKALGFLSGIAGDYEAILCARTGGRVPQAAGFENIVQLACGGGTVK